MKIKEINYQMTIGEGDIKDYSQVTFPNDRREVHGLGDVIRQTVPNTGSSDRNGPITDAVDRQVRVTISSKVGIDADLRPLRRVCQRL